jgi:pSer/pThr/pTyr-binding forkhead associated (FHA) protein
MKCGAEIFEGDRFCGGCGSPIESAELTAPPEDEGYDDKTVILDEPQEENFSDEETVLLEDEESIIARAHLERQDGERIEIKDENFRIGRSLNSNFSIQNKRLSRKHAEITFDGEGFFIEDLGSKNKSYVNGNRIEQGEKTPIKDGDIIKLADEELTFFVEED